MVKEAATSQISGCTELHPRTSRNTSLRSVYVPFILSNRTIRTVSRDASRPVSNEDINGSSGTVGAVVPENHHRQVTNRERTTNQFCLPTSHVLPSASIRPFYSPAQRPVQAFKGGVVVSNRPRRSSITLASAVVCTSPRASPGGATPRRRHATAAAAPSEFPEPPKTAPSTTHHFNTYSPRSPPSFWGPGVKELHIPSDPSAFSSNSAVPSIRFVGRFISTPQPETAVGCHNSHSPCVSRSAALTNRAAADSPALPLKFNVSAKPAPPHVTDSHGNDKHRRPAAQRLQHIKSKAPAIADLCRDVQRYFTPSNHLRVANQPDLDTTALTTTTEDCNIRCSKETSSQKPFQAEGSPSSLELKLSLLFKHLAEIYELLEPFCHDKQTASQCTFCGHYCLAGGISHKIGSGVSSSTCCRSSYIRDGCSWLPSIDEITSYKPFVLKVLLRCILPPACLQQNYSWNGTVYSHAPAVMRLATELRHGFIKICKQIPEDWVGGNTFGSDVSVAQLVETISSQLKVFATCYIHFEVAYCSELEATLLHVFRPLQSMLSELDRHNLSKASDIMCDPQTFRPVQEAVILQNISHFAIVAGLLPDIGLIKDTHGHGRSCHMSWKSVCRLDPAFLTKARRVQAIDDGFGLSTFPCVVAISQYLLHLFESFCDTVLDHREDIINLRLDPSMRNNDRLCRVAADLLEAWDVASTVLDSRALTAVNQIINLLESPQSVEATSASGEAKTSVTSEENLCRALALPDAPPQYLYTVLPMLLYVGHRAESNSIFGQLFHPSCPSFEALSKKIKHDTRDFDVSRWHRLKVYLLSRFVQHTSTVPQQSGRASARSTRAGSFALAVRRVSASRRACDILRSPSPRAQSPLPSTPTPRCPPAFPPISDEQLATNDGSIDADVQRFAILTSYLKQATLPLQPDYALVLSDTGRGANPLEATVNHVKHVVIGRDFSTAAFPVQQTSVRGHELETGWSITVTDYCKRWEDIFDLAREETVNRLSGLSSMHTDTTVLGTQPSATLPINQNCIPTQRKQPVATLPGGSLSAANLNTKKKSCMAASSPLVQATVGRRDGGQHSTVPAVKSAFRDTLIACADSTMHGALGFTRGGIGVEYEEGDGCHYDRQRSYGSHPYTSSSDSRRGSVGLQWLPMAAHRPDSLCAASRRSVLISFVSIPSVQ
eukprot:GHVQ01036052.1.p1 GENE.GHVQ01036052.1~~GHVQ01036052.1.p1  ORF type:complete len:1175 (-),score=132.30 GHVQ01036052.1:1581-5105(-)